MYSSDLNHGPGVVNLTRGEPHHLATLADALNVQETVEGILAG